jgi:hypothetical protein
METKIFVIDNVLCQPLAVDVTLFPNLIRLHDEYLSDVRYGIEKTKFCISQYLESLLMSALLEDKSMSDLSGVPEFCEQIKDFMENYCVTGYLKNTQSLPDFVRQKLLSGPEGEYSIGLKAFDNKSVYDRHMAGQPKDTPLSSFFQLGMLVRGVEEGYLPEWFPYGLTPSYICTENKEGPGVVIQGRSTKKYPETLGDIYDRFFLIKLPGRESENVEHLMFYFGEMETRRRTARLFAITETARNILGAMSDTPGNPEPINVSFTNPLR